MTQHVRMKRIIAGLLMISMLTGCGLWDSWFGREEINVGEYVTIQADTPEDGAAIRWIFSQLPDTSKLLGFLPSDSATTISFKPDVPGKYEVTLQLGMGEDVDETSYYYTADVVEDTSMLNIAVPDHLATLMEVEDTTVLDTPVVPNYTADGDQRRYLGKIVDPNRSKPTKKVSTPVRRKVTKTAPRQLSRGNLIPRAARTYTIQVSSWPSLEEAQLASQELLDRYGIESYIQRAFFKDKDEIFYRLRVGNFEERSAATAYAKEIQAQTNLPIWVDYIRKEM
ncbi:MAG: SPOR domain-containing protein [Candidatus Marinimicrobia bacterium]|nr:SPOR domain-containing protein [Candidatus Neomarinimicrobiota bacterium]MCF7851285.1 SPOR domain-containing protein [Candidatus Neomarinimicrobiota bacterium]MCF7905220.1 SPOR domain-containing protein [Candidatus Neomarinimicrobiota bacterium]